jgi:pimeloyl-ACP methyl ester carboxylesterase
MLQSESVALPGGKHVAVFKAGQGPAIVWLHGPHGVRGHDPLIAELAKSHTVIAPLSPGFNDVEELTDVDTVHDLALHYDAVFDALGLAGITLIGHSYGAMIAAEYAAHYPRNVKKLVLISPIGLWRDEQPLPEFFGAPYMTLDTLLWKGGKASPDMSDPADDPNSPIERQVKVAQGLTAVAKFTWPIPDRRLRRRLPRITADTLVIAGADDRFVPQSYVDDFAGNIRGARSAVVADAAHMVAYERQPEVIRLIGQFLGAQVRAA